MQGDPERGSNGSVAAARAGASPARAVAAKGLHRRFCSITGAALTGFVLVGASPPWWLDRAVISTNAPVATNDFGAINVGQIKQIGRAHV